MIDPMTEPDSPTPREDETAARRVDGERFAQWQADAAAVAAAADRAGLTGDWDADIARLNAYVRKVGADVLADEYRVEDIDAE